MTPQPRIGYVPYTPALDKPGDRRRFVHYARRRNLRFDLADPTQQYDLVILSERADLSVWSRYRKGKLVYDLIDSYLAIPRSDISGQLRGLAKFATRQSRYPQLDYWKAVELMCRRCAAVVCSTEEQRHDISEFCPNTHIVLDAHSVVTKTIKSDYFAAKPFRLVWEGLPQTMGALALIRPVLEELSRHHPVELHLVTDLEYCRYLGRYGKRNTLAEAHKIFPGVKLHEWRELDCADNICACDAAVIPLDITDPFAAGKPENKLLLFWRMAMPVVTSASPAYARAMAGAGMNLACKDNAQWLANLERLLLDQDLRRDAGCRGKAYAEREFGEEALLRRWDAVFASLGYDFGSQGGA